MKQESLQLTGGNFTQTRRALDHYPTPKNVTVALMEFLSMPTGRTIWEPACGDGNMSTVMESMGFTVYSTDINTDCYGDGGVDYLKCHNIKADCIITNPPFNLSELFIRKALSETRLVCMLLKSQYWHAKSRYELFKSNPPSYVLPLTWRPDFLEHERKEGEKKGAPTMEVAWSVWLPEPLPRTTKYKPLLRPCQHNR